MAYIVVNAWVSGVTPLLQNRATEEDLMGKTRSNNPTEQPSPRDQAEAHIYRLPNKHICVPGAAWARLIREAGSSHKAKGSRKSLKYLVPAAVIVLDDLCGLYLTDRKTHITNFEVDSRPVTIPATKGRIMRHRARFNEWTCKINIRINTGVLDEATIRRLLIDGSSQIGIGDFRPEKGGPFGTSDLVHWEVASIGASREAA